ncbi:MAG: hypothetical protein HUU35_06100, partial [Armatimonadetes bacterium]|nr:hypothetical protein [Armatimonadota bacterium]
MSRKGAVVAWSAAVGSPPRTVTVGFRPGAAGPETVWDNAVELRVGGQALLLPPVAAPNSVGLARPVSELVQAVGMTEQPGLRWQRHLLFAPPDLLVLADHLQSPQPRQQGWAARLATAPGLNLHARRIDLPAGEVTASLYLVLPAAVTARVSGESLEILTAQRSHEARLVTVLVLHETGHLPIPTRREEGGVVSFTWADMEHPRRLVVETAP